MKTLFKGELEIDYARGVVYFHNRQSQTLLRICRLKIPVGYDFGQGIVDITGPDRVNYITNHRRSQA